ncbi:MAG: Autotransporter-associated beta strand repeat protein [Verrucomicrobia bacterium]|nr:Autotransporter-associated beta strand repeat protein [Verrucomicrobiota bacterium]
MKIRSLLWLAGTLLAGATCAKAQFIWTGNGANNNLTNPANWQGGVAPVGTGGEDLTFGATSRSSVTFPNNFAASNVTMTAPNAGYFIGDFGQVFTLNGNATSTAGSGGFFVFNFSTLNLSAGTHLFSVAGANLYVFGALASSGNIVKSGANSLFIVTDDGASTYTGAIDLAAGDLSTAGDGSLGTGVITMNGGRLIITGYDLDRTVRLENSLVFSANVRFGSEVGSFALLTFAGAANAASGVSSVGLHVDPTTQVAIEGDVGETSPSTSYNLDGGGTVIFRGLATYTGGTNVSDGVLIFGNDAPLTGLMSVTGNAYIGTEATTNIQPHFLGRFNLATTTGIIGFDSFAADDPTTFSENIDLTGFDPSVRLGTSTGAVLAGSITPQGNTYNFGGRGVLSVSDSLNDNGPPRHVLVTDGLQLILLSTNLYTGNTTASGGGAVIFEGASSLSTGPLIAGSGGYIGSTDDIVQDATQFIGQFNTAATVGVIGFDTFNSPRTVSLPVDLTGFQDSVYIGSSTSVILNGAITPPGATYRFTGFREGHLQVDSTLTDINISTPRSVVIGQPAGLVFTNLAPGITYFPSVTLTGNNTYTGGTTLLSGELIIGSNTAMGTGTLTIGDFNPLPAGLSTNTPALTISNAINFGTFSSLNDIFTLDGNDNFTLAGDLSGGGSSHFIFKTGGNTITLSGTNSGLVSGFRVRDGELLFSSNNSAGLVAINLINGTDGGTGGTVRFTSAGPVMGTLSGDGNTMVVLATGGLLTIHQGFDANYDGQITGTGGLKLDGTGNLTLNNATNDYAGGTFLANGTLTITGSVSHPSADVTVAANATNHATLVVSGGGDFSTNQGFVGESGDGIATIDGVGSTWTVADELIVGAFDAAGSGLLNITNGGLIAANRGSIGYQGNGQVIMSGAGSVWNNNTYLYVGSSSGHGLLQLSNGAIVSSASAAVGLNGGVGQVTVTNTAVWNVNGPLSGGTNLGTAQIQLSNHGILNVNGGAGTVSLADIAGSVAHFIIGASDPFADGSIVNATAINGGAGAADFRLMTGNTSSAPYYFTRDGSSGGTPVLLTGVLTVYNSAGYNVLSGNNTYSGNTNITGGTLVAGSNNAFGTSTVHLQGGNLGLASGVTLTNTLDLSSGGTLSGNGTISSHINAGTGVIISPGNSPGTLTFASGLTWAPGGEYDWQLQTVAGGMGTSTGWDLISISSGTLDLSTLTPGSFTLKLISLNGSGVPGNSSDFNTGTGYSFTIATAVGGIVGFNAANIAIDASGFSNNPTATNFFLSVSGNNLNLNFTPVPEPSTYALLGGGLALLLIPALRRRK